MRRVFLSSTSEDLAKHRQAVRNALLDIHHGDEFYPVTMEHFQATDANALELCKSRVESCSIFIGIYARRYGYIPPGQSKSITELEYDWATKSGLERYIFVLDDDYPWPPKDVIPPQFKNREHKIEVLSKYFDRDENSRRKLKEFRARVGKDLVWRKFTTPDSLAAAVTQAVSYLPPQPPSYVKTAEASLLTLLVLQWLAIVCTTCGGFTGGSGPALYCLFCPWIVCPSSLAGLFVGLNLNLTRSGSRPVKRSRASFDIRNNGIRVEGPGRRTLQLGAANFATMLVPVCLHFALFWGR